MSEDIDFKLALPTSWSRSQARRKLSACRKELAETMRAADFDLPEAGIVTRPSVTPTTTCWCATCTTCTNGL